MKILLLISVLISIYVTSTSAKEEKEIVNSGTGLIIDRKFLGCNLIEGEYGHFQQFNYNVSTFATYNCKNSTICVSKIALTVLPRFIYYNSIIFILKSFRKKFNITEEQVDLVSSYMEPYPSLWYNDVVFGVYDFVNSKIQFGFHRPGKDMEVKGTFDISKKDFYFYKSLVLSKLAK